MLLPLDDKTKEKVGYKDKSLVSGLNNWILFTEIKTLGDNHVLKKNSSSAINKTEMNIFITTLEETQLCMIKLRKLLWYNDEGLMDIIINLTIIFY